MSLYFPFKPEVRLGKSPLAEVICQVKFSPILRISKEQPIQFQEAIRDYFPSLKVEQGVRLQFPGVDGSGEPNVEAIPRIYRFSTLDGNANIALAVDFYALSLKKYTHWQDFLDEFGLVMGSVNDIYRPSFATRIGLRFINRFTKKNTSSKDISEILGLFRQELTCLIQAESWDEPLEMLSQTVIGDGKAKLALRTGFGKEKNEPYFLLDFDYYEEGQLPLTNLIKRIERYHSRIYQAFRWCLLDGSLTRFEPLS
jgi:uncharacterized protein (TIGR04255 family)